MLDVIDAVALSVSALSCRPGARLIRTAWRQRMADLWRAGHGAMPGSSPLLGWNLDALLCDGAADRGAMDLALGTARQAAEAVLLEARRSGTRPLVWSHPDYPSSLAPIPDPPPVLWVRGAPETLDGPLVALVGARQASRASLDLAERLAGDLAAHGIGTVSGLARGVDGAAHRGALAAGGLTVGVLGCGTDVVYPPEHATLAGEVAARGALVSELPPGAPPRAAHFPRRNRIISGLAASVVVVEAGERSGSLITAHAALEQGREVMAVPGSVAGGRHRGCHGLIRDGAALVEDAGDILAALSAWPLYRAWRLRTRPRADPPLNPLLARMEPEEPYDLDELAAAAALDPVALLPCLVELEIRGAVRRDGAGRFVRSGGSC